MQPSPACSSKSEGVILQLLDQNHLRFTIRLAWSLWGLWAFKLTSGPSWSQVGFLGILTWIVPALSGPRSWLALPTPCKQRQLSTPPIAVCHKPGRVR